MYLFIFQLVSIKILHSIQALSLPVHDQEPSFYFQMQHFWLILFFQSRGKTQQSFINHNAVACQKVFFIETIVSSCLCSFAVHLCNADSILTLHIICQATHDSEHLMTFKFESYPNYAGENYNLVFLVMLNLLFGMQYCGHRIIHCSTMSHLELFRPYSLGYELPTLTTPLSSTPHHQLQASLTLCASPLLLPYWHSSPSVDLVVSVKLVRMTELTFSEGF